MVVGLILVSSAIGLRAQMQEQQREQWQRVQDIFTALNAKPGAVVADVGAGPGFFTVRLSRAVGDNGRVFAVDISPNAVRSLRNRIEQEGIRNVEVIAGDVDNPHLPEGLLDGALIVNAYHEMREHQAMLAHIKRALKPGGRLVIVEPASDARREADRQVQERQHEIAPQFVQQDARAAGFSVVGLEDPFSSHGHGTEYLIVLSPRDPSTFVTAPAHDHGDVDVSAADLRIAMDEFERLHRAGGVIVLDVRDSSSYERGHIPSARLAPMDDLRNQLDALKSAKQPIVTYCSCPAEESSARAAAYLRKNGVSGVRALTGGFEQWAASGRQVATGR